MSETERPSGSGETQANCVSNSRSTCEVGENERSEESGIADNCVFNLPTARADIPPSRFCVASSSRLALDVPSADRRDGFNRFDN